MSNNNDYSLKFLVYGSTGWIGGKIVELLEGQNHTVIKGKSRVQYLNHIKEEINQHKPDRVINCAGLTGVPNVDWCEDNQIEVINCNVVGSVNVATACSEEDIHLTYMGTGCIYSYDEDHQPYSGNGFTEEDEPNFTGSFYSKTKMMTEKLLKSFDNVLTLRIRMPISDDFYRKNLVSKLIKYEKVVNIPNSMSILHDLLPIAVDLSIKQKTGVYNFVNPGYITHNEVLTLYKEIIDNEFEWVNFTEEEQNKILKAERSNNHLDASKIKAEYPDLLPIKESLRKTFLKIKNNNSSNQESS